MSYEPTVWKDGDLVTSAKLNKMEQGIAAGGSGEMVGMTIERNGDTTTYTLNKTWQEIWDNNYTMVYAEDNTYGKMFYQIDGIDSSNFSVHIINSINDFYDWLGVDNANGYPTLTINYSPA